ncbi:hypothetical protein A6D6_01923 [Alcanivorax xiamenensis]|uniref:DUF2489 domain-containing protein n=1 Tax=Alcanivorax xiamenensis TaxID=1177156 RepID=A0ABQ6Y8E1_9GAMM|nr:hypothetical protein [Alcanivorax xiamenensis]KAF0805867.1 hypothetical protein A6D6_01923 [Alcanivorax xiamenensis]
MSLNELLSKKEGAMSEAHWTQILAAMLTPTVAILGSYIAWRQWKTAENRLKFDLFERRFAVYNAARKLIGSIAQSGKIEDEKLRDFLHATREAKWLFNEQLASYLDNEIWSKAVDLQTLDSELVGMPAGEERTNNIREQSEIKKWLVAQMREMDKKFSLFLKVGH